MYEKKCFNDDVINTSVLQQIRSENQSECVQKWAYYINCVSHIIRRYIFPDLQG